MYPIIYKIGFLTIYTYGLFVAIGILTAILIGKYEAERTGMNPEEIMDLAFYIIISGILGARLFYVATNFNLFRSDLLEIFRIWHGGLVYYGGFISSLIVAFIYAKIKKMPVWNTADIVALVIPAGHFFGRIGCFFAGCCYGKECDLPWAVIFSHKDTLARQDILLHPTQLYAALANLIVFIFLFYFRKHKQYDGQVFWVYMLVYGIIRSIIEIFRGDERGATILDIFSISQTIGLSAAAVSFIVLILYALKTKKT